MAHNFDPAALEALINQHGMNGAADRLRVSRRTVYRWRNGITRPTAHVARLIELEALVSASFNLGLINSHWDEWTLHHDGKLYFNHWRDGFTPGDIRAAFYQRQAYQQLKAENARLQQLVLDLQEQPAPGTPIPIIKNVHGD